MERWHKGKMERTAAKKFAVRFWNFVKNKIFSASRLQRPGMTSPLKQLLANCFKTFCGRPEDWTVSGPCHLFYPLSELTVSLHHLNTRMRQNTCYRNLKWTRGDSLPCYCYAIKANSRTMYTQVSQLASADRQSSGYELTANSSLHNTRTVNLVLVHCGCHTGK